MDVVPDHTLQDRGLAYIGFEGDYERHVIRQGRGSRLGLESDYVRNMKATRTAPAAAKISSGAFSMD